MSKSKRHGPASGADIIAAEFRRRGLDFNLERLEDQVAATHSRAKVDKAAVVQRATDLATAAKKARRLCELAEWDWRRNPSADNLAAARAAQRARQTVEDELREACLNDEQLIADLTRSVGR